MIRLFVYNFDHLESKSFVVLYRNLKSYFNGGARSLMISSLRIDTTTRVQILDRTVWISLAVNTLKKCTSLSITPPEIIRQTGLFNIGILTGQGERKLWIQSCSSSLKNWPSVASFSWQRDWVNANILIFCFLSITTQIYLAQRIHSSWSCNKIIMHQEQKREKSKFTKCISSIIDNIKWI